MKKHFNSVAALLVMIVLAFGSMDTSTVNTGSSHNGAGQPSGTEQEQEHKRQVQGQQTQQQEDRTEQEEEQKRKSQERQIQAREYRAECSIEQTIRDNLKCPSGASIETLSARHNDDGTQWSLKGTVAARNSFNAPLTQSWEATLRMGQDESEWDVLTLRIGEEVEYVSPKVAGLLAEQEQKANAEAARRRESQRKEEQERKAAIEKAKWRTWTSADGSYTMEAKYSGVAFGKVTLIKQDGSKVQVPLDKLSDEDQEWIASRKR